MIKYWNPRRVQRAREQTQRKKAAELQRNLERAEKSRSYTAGDAHKNVRLMLDALGLPLRRKMIARLAGEGAMSVSKLADPFNIFLPSALRQVRILERAGLVGTRKQGRVRICFLKPGTCQELSGLLHSRDILKGLD
ncbi:MAG: helix-turn-helix domain-containing protein [bacterium]|nr:helix-turn-helix domain-containing protein [bacterium]